MFSVQPKTASGRTRESIDFSWSEPSWCCGFGYFPITADQLRRWNVPERSSSHSRTPPSSARLHRFLWFGRFCGLKSQTVRSCLSLLLFANIYSLSGCRSGKSQELLVYNPEGVCVPMPSRPINFNDVADERPIAQVCGVSLLACP